MTYDFNYFSGRDLEFPARLNKPRLSADPSSVDARAYVDELERYEVENQARQVLVSEYTAAMSARLVMFKERLRADYDLTAKQFDVLWNAAWEAGHSAGLSEVYHEFDNYYDMATAFAAS